MTDDQATVRRGVIPGVLQKQLEEFQFLCSQRLGILQDAEWTTADLLRLDQRILAHRDGLLAAGEALVALVQPGLGQDEPAVAFAAAFLLLQLGTETAAGLVMEAFLTAQGGQLRGILQALCQGSLEMVRQPLCDAITTAPAPVCIAAAEALAFHGQLDPRWTRWRQGLVDENPQVRQAAWRVVALVDG